MSDVNEAGYTEPYTPTVEIIWEVVLFGAITNAQQNGVEIDEVELRAMYERFLESTRRDAIYNYQEGKR